MTTEELNDERIAKNTNIKINTLFGLAALIVVACLALVIYDENLNEFSKGVISLVLGRFLGYMDNIYNFELGVQTRSGMRKDKTIEELAKTTVPVTVVTPKNGS